MLQILVVSWFASLVIGVGASVLIAIYCYDLDGYIGRGPLRVLAIAMTGWALYDLTVFISAFIGLPRTTGPLVPVVMRLVAQLVKTALLIPAVIHIVRQKRERGA